MVPIFISRSVVLAVALLLLGCTTQSPPAEPAWEPLNVTELHEETWDWLHSLPCGSVDLRAPFFNVTGRHNGQTRPNTRLFLYTAPNRTLQGALYAADNCAPLGHTDVGKNTTFMIGSLPQGDYVAVIPSIYFVRSQGFPLPHEFDDGEYALNIMFHGGDYLHSLVLFSIGPSPAGNHSNANLSQIDTDRRGGDQRAND